MGSITVSLFALFILLVCTSNATDDLIVDLPVGKVQGRERYTVEGTPFYSYQGIPFAEAPVSKLRFQAPVEKQAWSGIIDGTQEKTGCFQLNPASDPQDEDCLFINVFTPRKPSNSSEKLAVMFFIYGGGFVNGYSTEINYGPQHLMRKDVVLVTSNYRIGALGFLSTGDLVVPGNAGLKDQNLALKWTNEYISYFGGDPEKITIFGQSAGAASVSYHILSPLSKGLFRAAISESGSALSPWAYQRRQTNISFKLAEFIDRTKGPAISNSAELLEFLQNQPVEVIQAAFNNLTNYLYTLTYPGYVDIEQGFQFAPVIEVPHAGAFLDGRQFELFESGDFNRVPWLAGFAASESLFYLNDDYWKSKAQNLDNNSELLIPDDMNVPDMYRQGVASMIKDFYVYNTTFLDNPTKLVARASDQSFTRSLIKQAQLQSVYTDVYLYYWRYLGPLGNYAKESVEGFSDDTRHGEELAYIFARQYGGYNTTDLSKYSEMDRLVLERFITMVTDFAKYLNPTPEKKEVTGNIVWPKFNETAHYLDIGSDSVVRLYPRWTQYAFWENIYNYGAPPFDTY